MKHLGQAAIILFFLAIQAVAGQNCTLTGHCIDSDLITFTSAQSAQECVEACTDNSHCNWFSFQPDFSLCSLFENCHQLSNDSCDNCITGEATCGATCNVQGSCSGQLDRFKPSLNAYDCLLACKQNDNCEWYTYDYFSGLCFMFKECVFLDGSKTESISGEVKCVQKMNGNILVSYGENATFDEVQYSEVFDSQYGLSRCQIPAENHFSLGGVGGLLYDSLPIYCGNTEACYTPGNPEPVARMSTKRYFAAAAVIHGSTLFVTGGQTETSTPVTAKSTEYVQPGKDPRPGPDMPKAVNSHCLINYNISHLYLIGGDTYSKETYFFNIKNEEWVKGPDLNQGRKWHSCGVILDETSNPIVVVIGGNLGNETEVLMPTSDQWTFGPRGPPVPSKEIHNAALVRGSHSNELMFIGGLASGNGFQVLDKVYKIVYQDRELKWDESFLGTLDSNRRGHVAFTVPDDYCEKNAKITVTN